MQAWITNFQKNHSGFSINYQPVGSGAGQSGILSKTFDYAGSDATLSNSKLANYTGTLLQIPEALGGVAIFYHIPEIGNVSLKFTGAVIAGIYMQNITMWNDPAITALNPGVNLPAKTIIPVHRSDGSGTTYALSDYLNKVNSSWATHMGPPATSLSWPQSELGGKGSSGVAGTVSSNPESIGYADSVYAISNKLPSAQIQNAKGNWIAPTIPGFQAAAASVPITNETRISITNAPDPNAYPITTYTWVLVWMNQPDHAKAYVIANFLWYVVHGGQAAAATLNYAPLPQNVVTIDEGLIKQISYNGTPILS
jgi:phosphate transport system substrate-binding protein